jgi:hypothetical protein
MSVTDKLNAASLTDAQAWAATPEQFTFCIDFLEISARHPRADHWVDQLELIFDGLLSQHTAINAKG